MITLGVFGVILIHQATEKAGRLLIGALYGSAVYVALPVTLSGTFTKSEQFTSMVMVPFVVVYLALFLFNFRSYSISGYSVKSYVCLVWGIVTLSLGVLAIARPTIASRLLRTLKSGELEGEAFLCAFFALGSLTIHSSLDNAKAAATVICSASTASLLYVFVALTHSNGNVRVACWPVVAYYTFWAALAMVENFQLKKAGVKEEISEPAKSSKFHKE